MTRPDGVPARVTIVEVGPRDGLQNEPETLGVEDRATFVDLLTDAGLPVIEVGAFVSARRVPQMADSAGVVGAITRTPGVRYTALVPNVRGLAQAHAAGLEEVAIFTAASETFSRRNVNQSIDETFATYADVARIAEALGIRVRGYLSTCFGCPYEGAVPPARVAALAARLLDLGVFEVAISDTIGVAHPGQVIDVLDTLAPRLPVERTALHLHDTRGTALANVFAALGRGVATFDASAGGAGGCPFAPGATGNLATEDLVFMLHGLGIETGVDLERVLRASRFLEGQLGRPLPSRYLRAETARRSRDGRDARA